MKYAIGVVRGNALSLQRALGSVDISIQSLWKYFGKYWEGEFQGQPALSEFLFLCHLVFHPWTNNNLSESQLSHYKMKNHLIGLLCELNGVCI